MGEKIVRARIGTLALFALMAGCASTSEREATKDAIAAEIARVYAAPPVDVPLPLDDGEPRASGDLDVPADSRPLEITPESLARTSGGADLRAHDSPVKNQGARLTCTAFAIVAALENMLHQEHDRVFDLSEEHLWSYYGRPSRHDALRNARDRYIATESAWPYGGRPAGTVSGFAKLRSYLESTPKVAAITDSLNDGRPVTISIDMNSSFKRPGATGIVDARASGWGERHFIEISAIQLDASVPGGGYFVVKNSWGTGWGNAGYGYLPFEYCRRSTCYAYLLGGIVTTRTIPAARP
jgi:hypothetical protein